MSLPEPNSRFPATVRISGMNSSAKDGGPAFVGQVFSMCDLSGTGLMAVSTHFDVPFLSKRTPEWLKKMFAAITKSERNGPVFRFFMDLGDAVSYVKKLNIPSGVVGACRLDLAYEHFKEKPHLFQFVPNERQVKEANKLLKTMRPNDGVQKLEGVPVFSAQNLDIAIATTNGIKWYTPYFFDKGMLDSILEDSTDQHFRSLIQTRQLQRRREIMDDNVAAEIMEEMADSMEPPEVHEAMDEMGQHGIPLSIISKAAEMQLLYAVDNALLGNRWLRKAAGIQPKYPYLVDSFEKRSATSFSRASKSKSLVVSSSSSGDCTDQCFSMSEGNQSGTSEDNQSKTFLPEQESKNFRLPFFDWLSHLWPSQRQDLQSPADKSNTHFLWCECTFRRQELQPSPFLPKITMVGISTGETGQMSKSTLKKTMDDLTKELEEIEQLDLVKKSYREFTSEERDPLFVANVGDYYSGIGRTSSARFVRGRSNK
ncbi:hypothetical protein LIER_16408 [Lithospermum erythrorhizon]|uniref:Tic22-like family protein n=1 Tax=Lithospermum erythrorhizon TaxID=34254 RepID=A0AAV3Q829_LITER